MTIRRLIVLLACTAAISVLTACSSSSPAPPPPPPPITISFQTAPPSSLVVASSTPVTAVVANDSSNAGVDWSVTCASSGACGSFNPTHTASGTATTYTAPPAIPAGNTVTITATSTADHTKSVSATISIVVSGFSNSSLNGNYVFEALGTDAITFFLYQVGGVLTADGNGVITGGELTYTNQPFVDDDPIVDGSYSIGADGRGTITVNTADPAIGENGTLTLGVVLASSSRALITQFDTSATSSGSMDLQTAVAAPTGGYAFVVNGSDLAFDVMAIGGVFNIDSPGVISGTGSVADIDVVGNISNSVTVTGTVSAPDPFGAVIVDLTIDGNATEFFGYIVDDTHIKLVESDDFGSMAGLAIGQGAATGTFLDDTAFSGTFVYGIPGQSAFGPAAFAGLFTADGAGNLTNGVTDENLGLNVVTDTLTGTYAVDGSGTGRAAAATTFGINGTGPTLIFYLTGNGNPPLVLNTDTFSLGGGIALPQAAGPFSFNGPYGLGFSAVDANFDEIDGTAQVTANAVAGTSTGTGDINIEDNVNLVITPTPNVPMSGTFTSSPDGRFDSTLTVNTLTVSTALYIVDATQGFIIENDSQQVALGSFVTQQ